MKNDLGIEPRDIQEMVIDMGYSVIELRLVPKKSGYLGHPSTRPPPGEETGETDYRLVKIFEGENFRVSIQNENFMEKTFADCFGTAVQPTSNLLCRCGHKSLRRKLSRIILTPQRFFAIQYIP